MSQIEQPRSAEIVRAEIKETVEALKKDLERAGDPTTGHEWRELALAKHMPQYTGLVFELAQLIGRENALKETSTNHIRIFHKFNSGTVSNVEDLYLNQQGLFLETLMDIALDKHGSKVPSQSVETRLRAIRARINAANAMPVTPEC